MKPSAFQLIDKPRVTKHVFQVNKEYDFSDEISLEIDKNIHISKMPNEERMALVTLNLMFFENADFNKVPFKLELEIEGIFIWNEEQEKEHIQLEVLLKENAPAILYSYLRPIITTTSIDANLPPLVIPLMNFRE